MDALVWVAWGAGALLVGGWLYVSFRAPDRTRSLVEWAGATALFVLLLCLFVSMLLRSLAEGSIFVTIALGFLVAFFSAGLTLCVVKAVAKLRGRGDSGPSATG